MIRSTKLFCLVALFLAAVTVPFNEHSINTAVVHQAGGRSVAAPLITADSLPVPWGKKPSSATAQRRLVADSLPVPWGKKPVAVKAAEHTVVADSLPVPWGKKPASA